jgi:hypothetical protein
MASYFVVLSIVRMNVKGALVETYLAPNAPGIISFHYESWWQVRLHLILF